MGKDTKEKVVGASGSVSGLTSFLGSWQICHNVCLGIIALLGVIGITIVGMPLLFLTKIAIPLWITAISLLLITIFFYFKKRCISNRLILFNSGLIIAGFPFQIGNFLITFWIVGGLLSIIGISLFFKDKLNKRRVAKDGKS